MSRKWKVSFPFLPCSPDTMVLSPEAGISQPSSDFLLKWSKHIPTCMCPCDCHTHSLGLYTCFHLSPKSFWQWLPITAGLNHSLLDLSPVEECLVVPPIFCCLQTMLWWLCLCECHFTCTAVHTYILHTIPSSEGTSFISQLAIENPWGDFQLFYEHPCT